MNLGLGDVCMEPTSGKKRKAEGAGTGDVQRILVLLTKLSLSNALQVRAIRAIVLDVYRVPTDMDMIQEALKATKKYAEQNKKLIEGGKNPEQRVAQIGLPHIHVWNMIIQGCITIGESSTDQELKTHAQHLKEYCAQYESKGNKVIMDEVKFVRVQRAYDRSFKRLEINVVDNTDSNKAYMIVKAVILKQPQVVQLPGVAPPGDLERQLQQFLDKTVGDEV